MPDVPSMILGEFRRTLDERHRVAIPTEMCESLTADSAECVLAKERAGCLSLWSAADWQAKFSPRLALVKQKLQAEAFDQDRLGQVQLLGRLLSTRHKPVTLAGRGRLLIPEGFRQFLCLDPTGEVMIVGAAVCVEIWHPPAWLKYLAARMPKFRRLFHELSK